MGIPARCAEAPITLMKRDRMKRFTILLASLALLGAGCSDSTDTGRVNNPPNPNGLGPAALYPTVSNGASVTLSGGAQAKNVFWEVAGQATLGTTTDFKGIILSKTLIAFNTGAAITGRALAQTAVTLNATAVTQP